jgi:DNA-binding transcriptional regulator LsrR (DeoR family)
MSQHILGKNYQEILTKAGAVGEILAYIYDGSGKPCVPQFNDLVIGIGLDDLKNIPNTIAVAAGQDKILPIYSALHGQYIKTLITDEHTAQGLIQQYEMRT